MSAQPPVKPKRQYISVPVSGYHRVYVEDEVDIELSKLDAEELATALEAKGWRCIPPPQQAAPPDLEYRLWEALHLGRRDEALKVAAEVVYDRLGRIV